MTVTQKPSGHDDYSLSRVPPEQRVSWITVAVQRFGQVSSFHQFLLGAVLGFGMTFWEAVIAITVGSVMLEIITIMMGIAGTKEGLSTALLTRWTGFGRSGSAMVGLLISLSLAGWFGVQNDVFAHGLHALMGGPPVWVWALAGGALVTAIVVFGFHAMAWTAYLTVPAFLALAGYSIIDALGEHSLADLVAAAPPGPAMSLAQGTTLVAGAFIMGAVMTPDMTRFNGSPADVVKQTLVSVTLGQYVIGLVGVLLAHAAKSSDVVGIITSSSGVLGTLILVTAILKINDWNLYSSSLGLINTVEVLFSRTLDRVTATCLLGAIGTVLSAIGILTHFTTFLMWIGVITPPVAGVVIAEYFLVKRWRAELEASRATGDLPATCPNWVPLGLVCWAGGAAVGFLVPIGIPTINSVIAALVMYVALSKVTTNRAISRAVGR
ncbi:Cytosine/purine/uracil/thiamine/allantoin permease family protein [Alloactinosynnema sp. L-07]|uniref:purine-cytosine permease family protein n=1 Tax=Alloactinosynnema sp. L-07 TaxID=1653480 RepID=UPI00065EF52B|nr:cytosine permease [Alloactinosynnema sp. L-07]CRK58361.1 Cytosine/purine/uracil/thiamine/allantoin permease family protein [Alloactinosynnema sp. L-07]